MRTSILIFLLALHPALAAYCSEDGYKSGPALTIDLNPEPAQQKQDEEEEEPDCD